MQASSSGLDHAFRMLHEIKRSNEGEGSDTVHHKYNAIRDDIQYLVNEHRRMRGSIEELKTMVSFSINILEKSVTETQCNGPQIREQLDLRHIRRTSILTLLAAIYIPFSFMSVSDAKSLAKS